MNRSRRLASLILFSLAAAVVAVASDRSGHAATVTASYASGHLDVIINGYGTAGLGAFHLDVGSSTETAWCVEAHVSHSTRIDSYDEVASDIDRPELDSLVWMLDRWPDLDDDTATAGAALVWFYAGAVRSGGAPVWSDGARNFAPITPLHPTSWDQLAPLTLDHPVGLRAGGADLDRIEHQVAELHRRAVDLRGPWTLEHRHDSSFLVEGPGGPIDGAVVRLTARVTGRDDHTLVATTGSDGIVRFDVAGLEAGADLTATVDSPGRHRAWDGDGDVQRMITATTDTVRLETTVAPRYRHVEIRKVSADPVLSPAGAEFVLSSSDGTDVGRGATDPDGVLRFAPVDGTVHPPPYTVTETRAPHGLAIADPVTVTDPSTDPDNPTVVRVVDQPILVGISVRKELSDRSAGPDDRSGFEFGIVRRSGGVRHVVRTGSDGATSRIEVPFGRYDICEVGVPDWATGLDDPGCVSVTVDDATDITVDYVNIVTAPQIDTVAADAADGDRTMTTTGGVVNDRVELSGLVPGTEYRLDGMLVTVDGRPTGVTSDRVFVAAGSTTTFDLRFVVPPLDPGIYVLVEELRTGSGVVAEHRSLDDEDQTIIVVSDTSTDTTTTTVAPTTVPAPASSDPGPGSTLPVTGSGTTPVLRLVDGFLAVGVVLVCVSSVLPARRRSPADGGHTL